MLNLDYTRVNYTSPGMADHMPQNAAEQEQGYRVGTWKQRSVFRCCLCPTDSFDQTTIEMHVFTKHHIAPPPESRPASALLFDANGEEVREVPNVPPPPHGIEDVSSHTYLEDNLEGLLPELLRSGVAVQNENPIQKLEMSATPTKARKGK